MAEELDEYCAVMGVANSSDAANLVISGLIAQQNRGIDANGIAGVDHLGNSRISIHQGSASKTYGPEFIDFINTWHFVNAIGHDRYSTSGSQKHGQPHQNQFVDIAFNGTASNDSKMRKELERLKIPHSTANDTDMMGLLLNEYLRQGAPIEEAMPRLMKKFMGGAAIVGLVKKPGDKSEVFGCLEAHGTRPLAIGQTPEGAFVMSSETHGLDAVGATFYRHVRPGEIAVVRDGRLESHQFAEAGPKFDIFEIIYFSHPDSLFLGIRIGDIRAEIGRQLAIEYIERQMILDDTVVIGIPNSGNIYAQAFAKALNLPYHQAIVKALTKDEHWQRTFIRATQAERQMMRNEVYGIITELVKGKNVIAIDDSLVRNNTAPDLTRRLLSKAIGNAQSVTWLNASPPIGWPNFYGIDTPDQNELAAARYTLDEIQQIIGCTYLGYLSYDGLMKAVEKMTGQTRDKFETSCLTGEYPISIGNKIIYTPAFMRERAA